VTLTAIVAVLLLLGVAIALHTEWRR